METLRHRNRKYFISRDVQFQEDVFPFMDMKDSDSQTPAPAEIIDSDWSLPVPSIATWIPPAVVPAETQLTETQPDETVLIDTPQPDTDTAASTPVISEDTAPSNDESINVTATPELLGCGHRLKKPSVLLRDYVTQNVHSSSSHALTPALSISNSSTVSGKVLYPIQEYLSNSGFSAHHIAFYGRCSREFRTKAL